MPVERKILLLLWIEGGVLPCGKATAGKQGDDYVRCGGWVKFCTCSRKGKTWRCRYEDSMRYQYGLRNRSTGWGHLQRRGCRMGPATATGAYKTPAAAYPTIILAETETAAVYAGRWWEHPQRSSSAAARPSSGYVRVAVGGYSTAGVLSPLIYV